MRNSSGNVPRNIGGDGGMMQSVAYPALVGDFLRERFGMLRGAEKMLARMARCSPRTAENWLRGESAPSGEALLSFMAECDGLADAVLAEVARRRGGRA
jgi:plasmid maintenance system antidote protein VapI